MDSTKKVTKKLAGGIGGSAAWMTNIGNEFGQVLNSVLTTGEGAGLEELCQGIVTRYKNVGKDEPEVIYVDRDCCSQSGVSSVTKLFHPWRSAVRLDSFHFMRRFNCGLTTEHHPLYGTFCAKLSSCIFEWDQEDVQGLKEAKRGEWKSSHSGHEPTEEQLLATITSGEQRRHCRRRSRGVEDIRRMISGLLESVWELTDTTGLRLVNHDTMHHVWEVQQKHLECLQDPPGLKLYTKVV
uniref:Transposase n=2 Tax=Knipowitschia caucasica TaxID=637954 RepID=A0AAV2LN60_KNICA